MRSPKKLIPDPQVCHRYQVTPMTIWRWDHDPRLAFPKPIYIRGRKYRDERELDAFDELCREKPHDASASPNGSREVGDELHRVPEQQPKSCVKGVNNHDGTSK